MSQKELFDAIRTGKLKMVHQLIKNGANINSKNKEGYLPIEWATWFKRDKIFQYLISSENIDLQLCDVVHLIQEWRRQFSKNDNQIMRDLIIEHAIFSRYIEIEDNDSIAIIINRLITTLLYENSRHGWDSKSCIELRCYVEYLNPTFIGQTADSYYSYIAIQETQTNTFYGSYLSDDSDSDEENQFKQKSSDKRRRDCKTEGAVYRKRAQIEKLTYQKKFGDSKKGDLKNIEQGSRTFDLDARTEIHYGSKVGQTKVKRDLNRLNLLLTRGQTLESAIVELQTQDKNFTNFFVAEYRGVTYLTTKWNKPSRKQHRDDPQEIGKPQYSASVMKAAGYNFFRAYSSAKQALENNHEVTAYHAELLREILLTMREIKPYSYNGYTYSSLAIVLQNIYTQDYDGFHRLIKTHPILKHLLLNDVNPFFSMGDTPYHAEKYAYGIKPYKGHEKFRLRPRWRIDGRAERPDRKSVV